MLLSLQVQYLDHEAMSALYLSVPVTLPISIKKLQHTRNGSICLSQEGSTE